MQLTAKVDFLAVQRALEQLGGRESQAAINRAINRAATTLKNEASKEVRKSYALKARDLGGRVIRVEKSTTRTLAADVRITGAGIPLSQYGSPRETKKGVTVNVKRGAGRVLYPRSFMATVKTGQQVYWRVKGDGPSGLVGRGPLRVLFGPSVAQIFSNARYIARIQKTAMVRIAETMRQELRYRLQRRAR